MGAPLPHLRSAIEALPGLGLVLPALDDLPPTYLVGGAVRDLLRGAPARDLDLVVEGPAEQVARELAARLGGEAETHERFGTATVRLGDASFDLATSRRERYRRPGALPEVEPAPIEEDLARRDFTVNAMAAPLAGEERGSLLEPHDGQSDLAAGRIRVLHPRSFVDDPTRLLRAIRYEARLGFAMDPETEALARRAIADGVSDTVSGTRIGAELTLLLDEERMPDALARLVDLGLDRSLHPALAVDPAVATAARDAAATTGADGALAALAAVLVPAPETLVAWLEGLGLRASERDRVARAARSAPGLAAALEDDPDLPPSALRDLLAPEPPEAAALALALGAPPELIARYIDRIRAARLSISGDDLVAAGAPPSPALGRALAETLRRKLDGEVSGRDEELRLALALAREEAASR